MNSIEQLYHYGYWSSDNFLQGLYYREFWQNITEKHKHFDKTIVEDNKIKYANFNASEEEIKEATKLSFSDEFIDLLPKKYDTLIGENGIRLSGGEKQRLSIARALYSNRKIYFRY